MTDAHLEGVTKFSLVHRFSSLDDDAQKLVETLCAWREALRRLGVVGQHPSRYAGAGFGNLSARLDDHRFLITGTQTGAFSALGQEQFAVVESFDIHRQWVKSSGPCFPSSEAMTHGSLYAAKPEITFVFHGHSPEIWSRWKSLALPHTPPDVAYGTSEMADAMKMLCADAFALCSAGLFCMLGHEDGVMSFGRSAAEAGALWLKVRAACEEVPPDIATIPKR